MPTSDWTSVSAPKMAIPSATIQSRMRKIVNSQSYPAPAPGPRRTLDCMLGHDHAHHGDLARSALRIAFILTLVILAVEAAAGYAANSLALMSDAGHIL